MTVYVQDYGGPGFSIGPAESYGTFDCSVWKPSENRKQFLFSSILSEYQHFGQFSVQRMKVTEGGTLTPSKLNCQEGGDGKGKATLGMK